MYTTSTCGDCIGLKRYLKTKGYGYKEVSLDDDREAQQQVRTLTGGSLSVPTLVFDNGVVLVEPSPAQVEKALALQDSNPAS